MSVYSYSRVSSQLQAEEGESLGTQQRMIGGFAQMNAMAIQEDFVERAVSGAMPFAERPEGARLLAVVKRSDVIVVAKLDRIFRDARDALNTVHVLKERGIDLQIIDLGGSVINNGVAKLFFTMLSAFAEFERDRIRERVREVRADMAKRDLYGGGVVKFGYDLQDEGDHKRLVPNARQQEIITHIKALRASGKSLRAIAEQVSKDFDVEISHMTVKSVISN